MHLLKCAIPVEAPTGVVTRPVAEGGTSPALQQTLVTNGAGQLVPLLGADSHNGLDLGTPLNVFGAPERGSELVPFSYTMDALRSPAWDSFTCSLFVIYGSAIVRVDGNGNSVTPVAGHFQECCVVNGRGAEARFSDPSAIVSDGAGNLYVADVGHIRRLQLPAAWEAQPPRPPHDDATEAGPCLSLTPVASPSRDVLDLDPEPDDVLVGTLPLESFGEMCGLAYCAADATPWGSSNCSGGGGGGGSSSGGGGSSHISRVEAENLAVACGNGSSSSSGRRGYGSSSSIPGGLSATGPAAGSLVFATPNAVYRLPLDCTACPGPGGRDAAAAAAATPTRHGCPREPAGGAVTSTAITVTGPTTAPITPILVAGREGDSGHVDGLGCEARFRCITGLVLDANGAAYVVDYGLGGDSSAVRRIGPDGIVTTLAVGLKNRLVRPAILPNGYLALCDQWSDALQLLDLGLTAVHAAGAAAANAGLSSRTLAADLGALLDRQPDGTADLMLSVGGRTFAVHRGILAARCDYFRRRLAGGFAEGSSSLLQPSQQPPQPQPPPSPPLRSPQPRSPQPQPYTLSPSPQAHPRSPQPQPSPLQRSLQPHLSSQPQPSPLPRSPQPQPSPQPRSPQPQASPFFRSPQPLNSPQLRSPQPHPSPLQLTPQQPTPQPQPQQPPPTPQPQPTPQHQHPQPQPPLQHLTLPDADPDAFALLLRFIYTGSTRIPTPLAPAVAELADRLLLPDLSRQAQAAVLAEVRPETVVGAMLWADSRGPGFASLLADLKAWYLEHHEAVVERAPGSVKRLMVERCELMMELHFNYKRMRGK